MGDLVVGIDMATQAVRAVCADAKGTVAASAEQPTAAPVSSQPGWSEQDATTWWPAVVGALRRLTSELGARTRQVKALAVSATSGTVVLADQGGEPLGPALLYDDRRATDEARLAGQAGAERWAELGLRPSATFGLPKWAWLLSHTDRSRARFAWHASDLVVARLIGDAPPTDWSHALKSGYDPRREEWATEALEALGIPERLVPEVRRPTTTAGTVCREAARATGLPTGTEVRLGMTDSCAGQLAADAAAPGRFVSVLGTTLVVRGATRQLVRDPAGVAYSHRHPDGWWLPGGASNTGGAALREWFPGQDLRALDDQAEARGPAGCVVYPLTRSGERFPMDCPEARAFWVGEPADDIERYRAVLEGVAFVERLAYERLARLGAVAEGPAAAAGTASRSRVWTSIRASVLGRPMTVAADATTAFGACLLAAAGTVHQDLPAATSAMTSNGEEVQPHRDGALDENFRRFVAALRGRGWIDAELAGNAVDGT